MIEPRDFLAALQANDVRFATGVPDSLLKDVCAAITDLLPEDAHVIAANEGAAVGLAIGHYLGSGRPALVYMQNSGMGNAVNPLTSLAADAVYGAPMVLMIGWRGEILVDGSQVKDEPQHALQGRLTLGQLDLLGVPWRVVDAGTDIAVEMAWAVSTALKDSRPVALVVRKGAFGAYRLPEAAPSDRPSREAAIAAVLDALPRDAAIVATTGMASRELFELRKARGDGHDRDFLTVGGMGHAISIACGIAMAQPKRQVVCLDGDGALLMHQGALSESARCANLIHVVLNNGAHDSVGGQPTAAGRLSLTAIAAANGYDRPVSADAADAIGPALADLTGRGRAGLLEVRCRRGARSDLGRPTRSPRQNKDDFMTFLDRPAP